MTSPALLLAGHGSADPAGVASFEALTERVAALLAPSSVDVAGGFIELSMPPLSAAVTQLTSRGHKRVVAVPVVLASAGHAKGDVPAALAAQRERHRGLSFAYGRPLAPHPLLLSLLAARIADVARDGTPGAAGGLGGLGPVGAVGAVGAADPVGAVGAPGAAAVLVVGRGSTDPDANADLFKTSRLLWETHGYGGDRFALTETAFVSLARPGVGEGLERCRRLGARRVIVARYFLFPGVLPDRVAAQARAYAAAHPELDVRCSSVLDDCDGLAEIIAQRYREALAGDIRMNCDMCVYRVALPGFGHRAGAPSHPHFHPAEHPAANEHVR